MQQLQFEASWYKTLSVKDRQLIEQIFNETKSEQGLGSLCSPIREAINHKQELLVTVLVHNFTQYPLTFNNTPIVYSNEQAILAEKEFTLPSITIPPKISMPWTFIFPQNSYTSKTSLWNGRLEIQ